MQKTATYIKDKLYQTIENIDDVKVLEALYVIMGNYTNEASNYKLTDKQLKELKQREAHFKMNGEKGFSIEEHTQMTKNKYGF